MASQTSPMVAQSGEVGTDPAERSKPKASGRIHSVIGTVIHHETAQGGQGKLVRRSTQHPAQASIGTIATPTRPARQGGDLTPQQQDQTLRRSCHDGPGPFRQALTRQCGAVQERKNARGQHRIASVCQKNMLNAASLSISPQCSRAVRNGMCLTSNTTIRTETPIRAQTARKLSGGYPVAPNFITGQFMPQTKVSITRRATCWRDRRYVVRFSSWARGGPKWCAPFPQQRCQRGARCCRMQEQGPVARWCRHSTE